MSARQRQRSTIQPHKYVTKMHISSNRVAECNDLQLGQLSRLVNNVSRKFEYGTQLTDHCKDSHKSKLPSSQCADLFGLEICESCLLDELLPMPAIHKAATWNFNRSNETMYIGRKMTG